MKHYDWDPDKNEMLKKDRNISFEKIVLHLENDDLISDIKHPNSEKYDHQRILLVKVDDYVYMVPYIETEYGAFLKTIIPSRKMTKKYLEG